MEPFISIIIPLFNNFKFIEESIKSVIEQDYENYELIIIDGGSNDGSWQIVLKYEKSISYKIHETDDGIYDAMNKGIQHAKGNWIYFLGSDDKLRQGILRSISKNMKAEAMLIYGDVYLGKGVRYISKLNKRIILQNTVHHQATFYNNQLFNNFRYDTSLQIISDYELNLKIYLEKKVTVYVNMIIADCRDDGKSSNIELSIDETNIVRGNAYKTICKIVSYLFY